MGNSTLKFQNDEYKFYSSEIHPLEGQVDVYRQQTEGNYVMKKITMHSDELISLANNIQKDNCTCLILYYGHEEPSSSALCTEIIRNISATTYWQYLNHDLQKDSLMNKNTKKEEKKVWEVMASASEAGRVLNQHGLAIQFNHHNIQFAPDHVVKIYWANLQTTNMHRSYFKYFFQDQLNHALYSPQQLQSLKSKVLNKKINIEKSSIYSLGMLIMSYVSGIPAQEFYDYKNMTLNSVAYEKCYEYIRQNYSSYLGHVIRTIIDPDPNKRMNYQILMRMTRSGNKQPAINNKLKVETSNRQGVRQNKSEKISFKH